MTPKEKARELIDKFKYADEAYYYESFKDTDLGKICALVAVNEIIDANPLKFDEDENPLTEFWWEKVKKEIEKL